jgi:hypothetical protein
MATAAKLASELWQRQQRGQWQQQGGWKASYGNINKESNGNGNEGGKQAMTTVQWQRQQGWQATKRAMAMVARAIVTATRVLEEFDWAVPVAQNPSCQMLV